MYDNVKKNNTKKIIRLGAYEIYPFQYCRDKVIRGLNYELIVQSLASSDYKLEIVILEDTKKNYANLNELGIDGFIHTGESTIIKNKDNSGILLSNYQLYAVSTGVSYTSEFYEIESKNLNVGYLKDYKNCLIVDNNLCDNYYEYNHYKELLSDLVSKNINIAFIDRGLNKILIKESLDKTFNIIVNFAVTIKSEIIFKDDNSIINKIIYDGVKKLIDTNQYFEIVRYWENYSRA